MKVILVAYTAVYEDLFNDTPYVDHDYFDDYPSDHDTLAEFAGRSCYEAWERKNPKTKTNEGYLANIINKQHFSVLEHASATFYITGVTRNLTHELIRHRHLSYSEVSQRYVDVGEFDFVGHPILDEQHIDNNVHVNNLRDIYNSVAEDLVEAGYKRKEARQAARAILPGGLETKIVVTGNHRAWREVIAKRNSPEADSEIQLLAAELLRQLKRLAPNTYQDME